MPASSVNALQLVLGTVCSAPTHPVCGIFSSDVYPKKRHAVLLRDGDTWVWKHADDLKHKHGVWFPTLKQGRERDGQRWAFMFRWSNGRKRSFDLAYPHRLQMTEAELAQVAARRAECAARAARQQCPPPPIFV